MWVLKQEPGSLQLPFSPTKPCTEGATLNRWCQTLPWQQVSLQTEQGQDRVRQRQAGCPAGTLPPTPYLHNQSRPQKEDMILVERFKSQQISVPQVQFLYLGNAKPNWTQSSINFNWLIVTSISSQDLHWEMEEAGKDCYPPDSETLEFSPTYYKLTTLNQIKCKPNSFCGTILQNIPQSLKRINFIVFFKHQIFAQNKGMKIWKDIQSNDAEKCIF